MTPHHANDLQQLYHIAKNNQLPHAVTFAGNEGNHTLAIALNFAQYLHCPHKQTHKACGYCASCVKMQKNMHPDLHYAFPISTAQKNQPLNEWQDFLQKNPYPILQDWKQHLGNQARNTYINKQQVHYIRTIISKKPFESQCKTVIVWLPETLHPIAANAMLKIVEEPTPNTFFIFVSNQPHHILSTLRSRLWHITIPKPSEATIKQIVTKANPNTDPNRLDQVINIAQSNINLTQKLLTDQQKNHFEHFVTWMRNIYTQHLGHIAQLAETFHQYNAQTQKNWITYALQLLRNILLTHYRVVGSMMLSQQESDFCYKFSQAITIQQINHIIEQIFCLHQVLQRNANPKLAFINTSLHILHTFSKTT